MQVERAYTPRNTANDGPDEFDDIMKKLESHASPSRSPTTTPIHSKAEKGT
jgi:hypothetical protein